MKQLTARLVDIARAQNTQVEGAKQDSLVSLESRLSAVTELPHALRDARIVPVGSVAPETFPYQSLRTQNGAVAALNVDGPLLDIALYHIQGFCRIQFTGTIANASLWTVSLLDPIGPNEFPLAEAVLASSPLVQIIRVDTVVLILTSGWKMRHRLPATVAGDFGEFSARLLVNRLF